MSRPAVLFAVLGIAGVLLPLVQLRANRIVAGEGLGLGAAFPGGAALATGLILLLLLGCVARLGPAFRLAAAALGCVAIVIALGLAAGHLTPEGNRIARVAPASGFWLLLLGFALMLADAIARLRPSAYKAGAILLGALIVIAGIFQSGVLDDVSVMREYAARRAPFLDAARSHLVLAFGSLGLALLIGMPLGAAIFQRRRWRGPVLAVLNVLQTIPSLALFGIMIPLLGWVAASLPGAARLGMSGIGMFPALVALFLYALLPVVSNTLAGLSAVPAAAREAAAGLGMTRHQVMLQVLAPMALPALLAAVRIVLVQNIGLAVIAGLIGGGGFGTFVFQGLNQTAMDLILLGALPTIGLALLAGIVMDLLVRASRGGRVEA